MYRLVALNLFPSGTFVSSLNSRNGKNPENERKIHPTNKCTVFFTPRNAGFETVIWNVGKKE